MKPIEPGCLAVVVGTYALPEVLGATVTVIERCMNQEVMTDQGAVWIEGRLWFIDPGFACPAGDRWAIQEQYLMRIDGGQGESVSTEQEREVEA